MADRWPWEKHLDLGRYAPEHETKPPRQPPAPAERVPYVGGISD